MSTLKQFLIDNSNVTNEEHSVTVSKRFKDEKGNILKFKIKPVSGDEFNDYQKKCTSITMVGRKRSTKMDSGKFNNMIIINHVMDPDFKDKDLLKSLSVQTPEQALQKVLLAGEIIDLAERISEISGFDTDINEEIENAKN